MNNLTTANHLTYQAKINNGSFYTPPELVNYVWELITPFLTTANKLNNYISQLEEKLAQVQINKQETKIEIPPKK